MSDLRKLFDEATAGFAAAEDDALRRTILRGRQRRAVKRIGAGVTGLALTLVVVALAWAALPLDPGVRPLVGPTATPTISRDREVAGATLYCWTFQADRRCIERTTPFVDVAGGDAAGHPWEMRMFAGIFTGSVVRAPDSDRDPPNQSLLVVCRRWRPFGGGEWQCGGTLDDGSGMSTGLGEPTDGPPLEPAPPVSDQTRPLQGLEDTGGFFSGGVFGDDVMGIQLWTPDETHRVDVTVDFTEEARAELFGPFPELNPYLKLAVVLVPGDVRDVVYVAYDDDGNVLWREHDRFP